MVGELIKNRINLAIDNVKSAADKGVVPAILDSFSKRAQFRRSGLR